MFCLNVPQLLPWPILFDLVISPLCQFSLGLNFKMGRHSLLLVQDKVDKKCTERETLIKL